MVQAIASHFVGLKFNSQVGPDQNLDEFGIRSSLVKR